MAGFKVTLSALKDSSIQEQIAGMYSWAVEAYKCINDPKQYPIVKDSLRNINRQGRRLEWRGGASGLKYLPELEEVKVLKKKISEARADAQTALDAVRDLENSLKEIKQLEDKLKENETKLSSAGSTKKAWISANIVSMKGRLAKVNKEIGEQKKTVGKTVFILTEVLKKANALAQEEPWVNPKYFFRLENRRFAEMFLRREGFYKTGDYKRRSLLEFFIKNHLFRVIDITGAYISGDCSRVDFSAMSLRKVRFENIDLTGANFTGSTLEKVQFYGNCNGAIFNNAELDNVIFEDVNLESAGFVKAHINFLRCEGGNLSHVLFTEAKVFRPEFIGTNLNSGFFDATLLTDASFINVNLTKASFLETVFVGRTVLKGTDLTDTDFKGATGLTKAHLKSAKNVEKARNVTFPD